VGRAGCFVWLDHLHFAAVDFHDFSHQRQHLTERLRLHPNARLRMTTTPAVQGFSDDAKRLVCRLSVPAALPALCQTHPLRSSTRLVGTGANTHRDSADHATRGSPRYPAGLASQAPKMSPTCCSHCSLNTRAEGDARRTMWLPTAAKAACRAARTSAGADHLDSPVLRGHQCPITEMRILFTAAKLGLFRWTGRPAKRPILLGRPASRQHHQCPITEMRILLRLPNWAKMSYSACQIGPSVSYWFQ
jgi:hypothetical protein